MLAYVWGLIVMQSSANGGRGWKRNMLGSFLPSLTAFAQQFGPCSPNLSINNNDSGLTKQKLEFALCKCQKINCKNVRTIWFLFIYKEQSTQRNCVSSTRDTYRRHTLHVPVISKMMILLGHRFGCEYIKVSFILNIPSLH